MHRLRGLVTSTRSVVRPLSVRKSPSARRPLLSHTLASMAEFASASSFSTTTSPSTSLSFSPPSRRLPHNLFLHPPSAPRPLSNALVLTDLDGTLLPAATHALSARNHAALLALGALGAVRVVVTGRNAHSLAQVLPVDAPIDYAVTSSGACVLRWPDRGVVESHSLEPAVVQSLIRFLLARDLDFFVHAPVPDNHHFFYHASAPTLRLLRDTLGEVARGETPGSATPAAARRSARLRTQLQSLPLGCASGAAEAPLPEEREEEEDAREVSPCGPPEASDETFSPRHLPNSDFVRRLLHLTDNGRPLPSLTSADGAASQLLVTLPFDAVADPSHVADRFRVALARSLAADGQVASPANAPVPSPVAAGADATERAVSVVHATSPLDGRSIWLELFPSHVDKGQAVERLVQHVTHPSSSSIDSSYNSPRDSPRDSSRDSAGDVPRVLAVGNDFNDLPLLDFGARHGLACVVSNAPPSLLARARPPGAAPAATAPYCGVAACAADGFAEAVALAFPETLVLSGTHASSSLPPADAAQR